MILRRTILVLRLVLGAIFLYAAWTKLRQSYLIFAMSIDAYQLLPTWAVLAVARTLPWFELIVGVLLLTGYKLRWSSVAATGLLGMFFALMMRSYLKGEGIDCGCFGLGDAISIKTLLRDGSMLVGALLLTVGAFIMARKNGSRTAATPDAALTRETVVTEPRP
jgi:putative oxidoreductase